MVPEILEVVQRVLAHLFQTASIQENPTNLDDLSRIPCHVHPVFIASRGNMDNDVSVDLKRRILLGRHNKDWRARSSGPLGKTKGASGEEGRQESDGTLKIKTSQLKTLCCRRFG